MGEDPNHKVDGSLVTADTTSPTISSVSFADSPGPDDDNTYGAGDWVSVHVTFSESVVAIGTPQVELNIGGTSRMAQYGHLSSGRAIDPKVAGVANPTVVFGYTVQEGDSDSASGATLVFSYTVAVGDADIDGIAIGANKLTLNGGIINDAHGNTATLTHDTVANDDNHKVDAPDVTAPTISSVAFMSDPGDDDIYGVGDSIEVTVTFSKDVKLDVSGTLQLELDVGGTAKNASYSSADGAEVVFSYTVAAAAAAADGIAIGENKIDLDDGTIEDDARNQPRGISPVGSTQRTTASGDSKAQYRVVLSAFVVSKSHAGGLCLPTLLQSERF